MTTSPDQQTGRRRLRRPADSPGGAAVIMTVVIAIMIAIEVIDVIVPADLDRYGIRAQEPEGLPGILSAPWLHHGFGHLWSNAVPLFVLGWLTLLSGLRKFLLAVLGIVIVSGLAAWALTDGPGTQYVVGASGVVFGLLTYLLARGIITRDIRQIAVSVIVLILYGGVLWGVLPTQSGVSWQGHLGGAVAGVLMAWLLNRQLDRRASRRQASTASPTL